MDTTYKESLIGQIEGNAKLDFREADELIRIANKFSENQAKTAVLGKKRFFYTAEKEETINTIKGMMTASEARTEQKLANKRMREFGERSRLFETTYTRGGHKYVDGVRIY